MKSAIILIISLSISFISFAQWEQHEIVPFEYKDTRTTLWVDLNGDDQVDLLGYDDDLQTIFWRENNGEGFTSGISIGEEVELEDDILTTTDWDNDGDIDIIAQTDRQDNKELNCIYLENNGDGTFVKYQLVIPIEVYNGNIFQFGDVNGDGQPDMIIRRSFDYFFSINDNGIFTQVGGELSVPVSLNYRYHFADLNGDGKDEIIELDGLYNMNILEYQNGSLETTQIVEGPISWDENEAIHSNFVVKDVDFDGDLDILRGVWDFDSGTQGDIGFPIPQTHYVLSHIQDENGQFSTEKIYTKWVGNESFQYTWKLDEENQTSKFIVFDNGFWIEYGLDNGTWVELSNAPYDFPQSASGTLKARNIFDNAHEQLYSQNFQTDKIYLGTEDPNTTDNYDWSSCVNCSQFVKYVNIETSDLDNDGDQDILVISKWNADHLVWIENYEAGCHFDQVHPIVSSFTTEYISYMDLVTADFDNDGDIDIAAKIDDEESKIYLLKNDGEGNFTEPTLLLDIGHANEIYAEDLFNDGYPEIIIRTGQSGNGFGDPVTFTATILHNTNGIENFNQDVITQPNRKGTLIFKDIDNDGDLDMASSQTHTLIESMDIYINDGTSFILSDTHDFSTNFYNFDLFDYNQDNFPDLVVSQDDLSGTEESTLYLYNNNAGIIDFDNPVLITENIRDFKMFGIHNPDNTYGYVFQNGYYADAALVHLNQSGTMDTLIKTQPEEYLLADLNNDGYQDILSANRNSEFVFFTMGYIDCPEACTPDTEGFVSLTECDGQELFIIETTDGQRVEAFLSEGVDFNFVDQTNIKFHALDLGINGICSDTKLIEILCIEEGDPILSDEEILSPTKINIYPNPVHDILHIDHVFTGKMKVMDAQGKCIYQSNTIPTSIDLQNFQSGIYFFSFENKKEIITQRIIKM